MDEDHNRFLRAAFDLARQARMKGNHPFGAVLVDEGGQIILEAENTVVTAKDSTGHAETNLVREASARLDPEMLRRCTVYTSTEPCPMCAGAIFWAGVGRVVYGLSQEGLYAMIGSDTNEAILLPCREVFERGRKPIEVIGPMLEPEAGEIHAGFWAEA